MSDTASVLYRFGPFTVDERRRLLFRDGRAVPLTPKAFDLLLALLERPAEVRGKDELMNVVWPGQALEDANLSVNMSALRKALDEQRHEHKYIATIPGRGYTFVANVSKSSARDDPGDVELHFRSGPTPLEDLGALRPPSMFNQSVRPAIVTLVGLLTVAVVAFGWWMTSRGEPLTNTRVRSIVVLPFRPLGAAGPEPSLAFGLAEMLTTRLSQIEGLVVRPVIPASREGRGDFEDDEVAVGRALGAESVLVGAIQHTEGVVRVTVRLVRVRDHAALWADRFDEPVADLLTVEESISRKIARAVSLELTGSDGEQGTLRYTKNPEAYRLYLLGRFHWSTIQGPSATSKSIEHFDMAATLDPNFALAYAGLADAYLSEATELPTGSTAGVRASAAANRAVDLDDRLAEAHVSLGRVKAYLEFDWDAAGREFVRAIELHSNSADARREYGLYLAVMGRHNDALTETRRALELDPTSLMTNFAMGWALISARQYDQTIAHFQRALEIDPRFAGAPHFIGMAYVGKSMFAEAVAEFWKALRLQPDNILFKAQLGFALARVGRTHEADAILADFNASTAQRYVSPYYSALVLAGLNRTDLAFVQLERAYQDRSRRLWALKVIPAWDRLRGDDRYRRLLQRIGLPN